MGKNDRPFVGVDLGGTNIGAGVVDNKHAVIATSKKKTRADKGEGEVIDRIVAVVKDALEEAGMTQKSVGGLGIGAPGAIDGDSGVVLEAVNLRWTNFPLADELSKKLDMPVVVDNDVNVGAWGEYVAGAGRGHDSLLGVFVGTGIGGGLILGGKLYHGHFHTAGEIGHVVIHADAPLGRRTLERTASRTYVADQIRKLIESNRKSKMVDIVEGDLSNIRSKALAKAIEIQDPLTVEVVRQSADYVGIAIANMVTVLSLPCAVVGGGLNEALGEVYTKWVRKSFEKHVFPAKLRECKIVSGQLGDHAGTIGAADLARRRVSD